MHGEAIHPNYIDNQTIVTNSEHFSSLLCLSALSAEVNCLAGEPSAVQHHKALGWRQLNEPAFRVLLKEVTGMLGIPTINTWSDVLGEQLYKRFLDTAATGPLTQASTASLSVRNA